MDWRSHHMGRDFPELCPDHKAAIPLQKQSWLCAPTLTQKRGRRVLRYLLTSLSPNSRLVGPLREDGGSSSKVLEEEKEGEVGVR